MLIFFDIIYFMIKSTFYELYCILGLNRCNSYKKKINLTSLKMSPKFAKFVLVQATQSNVLPHNGCLHENTLMYTARNAQLSIFRFALLASKSMELWHTLTHNITLATVMLRCLQLETSCTGRGN